MAYSNTLVKFQIKRKVRLVDRWRTILLTEQSSLDCLKVLITAIPRRERLVKKMNSHFIIEIVQ